MFGARFLAARFFLARFLRASGPPPVASGGNFFGSRFFASPFFAARFLAANPAGVIGPGVATRRRNVQAIYY